MTSVLVLLATALLVARAGDEVATPTGRILRVTPRPPDAPLAQELIRAEVPWPYQGDLGRLHIVGTLWSVGSGAAVLRDSDGDTYFVPVGARLGERGGTVVAVGPGRVEVVEPNDSPVLDHAWCRLVLERVEQRIVLPAAEEGQEPTIRTRVVTRLHTAECARHAEDLLL